MRERRKHVEKQKQNCSTQNRGLHKTAQSYQDRSLHELAVYIDADLVAATQARTEAAWKKINSPNNTRSSESSGNQIYDFDESSTKSSTIQFKV